jgi:hypothetical protein
LNADDLFDVIKIVNKIGVKEVKNCFNAAEVKTAIANASADENSNNDLAAAVGLSVIMEVASLVVSKLPDCKTDLYRLLSNLSGIDKKEIAAMNAGLFFAMVVDVIKHPSFGDFFQQLVGLFK